MSATPVETIPARADLRTLLKLAWPVVLARSTQSVVGVCDALMCAPLGGDALAAATTGAINTFSLIILPMGTVFIVQSFAAQYFGRGDLPSAARYAWYGLVLAAIAMVVAIAATPIIGPVLGLFRYEPAVHDAMTGYIGWRLWSVGAVVGIETIGNWFAGLGDTRLQMRAGVVTMVANIALNWVLIYGKFGAPAMGVEGAALASALASWCGFALVALAFRWRHREISRGAPLGLRRGEFLRMLRFGLPNGFNWTMEFAAFVLFINVLVGALGTHVLAAFNVILNINMVSFMPAFGVSSAGAILAGQAIGAGHPDQVPRILRLTAGVMMTWMGGVGLAYLFLPRLLMSAFAPPDASAPALLAVGAMMLRVTAVWQIFDALGLAFGEILRAAGDTAWCMWARLVVAWLVFWPVAYWAVVVRDGGPAAAIWSVVFYLAVLAVALGFRFRSGAWRRIQMTGHDAVV